MMTDLISRAAAIEYLMTNMGWRDEDGYEVDDADEKRAIITDLVNGIPAVDVVPVIRCRDCEHFIDMTGTSYPSYCYKHTTFDTDGEFDNVFSVEPDKYCAWGERRDSE